MSPSFGKVLLAGQVATGSVCAVDGRIPIRFVLFDAEADEVREPEEQQDERDRQDRVQVAAADRGHDRPSGSVPAIGAQVR